MFGFKAERRIGDLEEDFAKLKRDFASLEMEWTNAYDKLRKMMQRVAKRAEVAEHAEERTNGELPAPPSTGMHGGRMLTDAQMRIQQDILRRRAGG